MIDKLEIVEIKDILLKLYPISRIHSLFSILFYIFMSNAISKIN
jgi:hypothetical protein